MPIWLRSDFGERIGIVRIRSGDRSWGGRIHVGNVGHLGALQGGNCSRSVEKLGWYFGWYFGWHFDWHFGWCFGWYFGTLIGTLVGALVGTMEYGGGDTDGAGECGDGRCRA